MCGIRPSRLRHLAEVAVALQNPTNKHHQPLQAFLAPSSPQPPPRTSAFLPHTICEDSGISPQHHEKRAKTYSARAHCRGGKGRVAPEGGGAWERSKTSARRQNTALPPPGVRARNRMHFHCLLTAFFFLPPPPASPHLPHSSSLWPAIWKTATVSSSRKWRLHPLHSPFWPARGVY